MVMETIQVMLTTAQVKLIDNLVSKGVYANRSEAVRTAVRTFHLYQLFGIIPNTGDSVKEFRELRKKLSAEDFDLDEINRTGE